MNCCDYHCDELPSGCLQGRKCPLREAAYQAAMHAPIPRNDEAENNPIPTPNEVMRVVFICVGAFVVSGFLAALLWPVLERNWATLLSLIAFT